MGVATLAFIGSVSLLIARAAAQEPGLLPAIEPGELAAGPPVSHIGCGSFFSQELGTLLRVRYSTESYGQDERGNLDIGTMQVFNFEDAIAFFDGQVTLNDQQGTGFNAGVGWRWLDCAPLLCDAERMSGVSVWADGTSTEADNFFPQLGVSYESLGECWDFRANGYIPLGHQDKIGQFEPTGEIGFQDNFLSELTQATVDTSFNAAELEVARRLGPERDAWFFGGGYALVNDDQDTGGYRLGVRGYAYPDLMVQLAVSNDEIFHTNATFSLIWFVGRTRSDYRPTCGLADRFREPVMRNDYVVLAKGTVTGGVPLTDVDGNALRFVHVNENAGPGGDGTFENPFDVLSDINGAGSQEGDIVLAWAESDFTGDSSAILKDNQQLLGEGNDMTFTVFTSERGTIDIPETSPGARSGDRPEIIEATGDAIVLADGNEVANFDVDGNGVTTRAIASPAAGSGNPNLHDLAISDTTGDAIALAPLDFVDADDIDDDDNTTETFVRGSVTIDQVTFDNIGGDDIDINSETDADVTDPTVTLQETIAISDVTSTNGNGAGLRLANTHSAGRATITNYTNGTEGVAGSGGGLAGEGVLRFEGTAADDFAGDVTINNADIRENTGFAFDFLNTASTTAVTLGTGSSWDGGTGAAGGIRANNFNGTMTASSTTLENGDGTLGGVQLLGASDGTFTFQNTVTFTDIDGTDFLVDGDFAAANEFTGTVTVASELTNNDGQSVVIRGTGGDASITLNGDITDSAQGILVESNDDGSILFSGDLTMTTTTNTAITLDDNADADISFSGQLGITTTSGNGFVATNGGNLTVGGNSNSIETATGQVAVITGMTINSAGANFADVNRSTAVASRAIDLNDNTGGPITFGVVGDDAGEGGTLAGGAADTVRIRNSANTTISGVIINSAAGQVGVVVDKTNTTAMTLNLNDLQVNDGNIGVDVDADNTTGNLNMTVNDTEILGSTEFGLSFVQVDSGSIQINNAAIDGNNAGATAQGVLIEDSSASFTFDSDTTIQEWGGTDFEVNGGTGTISFAGDIVNTDAPATGRSVEVRNITGGSVTFTAASSINDDNQGMLIASNGTGTISFLGTNTFNTSGDAVTLLDNDQGGTNANITLAGLNITTTGTGRGLVATGGGTLSVTGTNNQIDSENGAGLVINDMTIGTVDFAEATVDGVTGPTNAIDLRNLTGGQVAIGTTTGAQNSGGQLRSTGDAIVLSNVQNVDLRQMQILGAGGQGLNIDHTNTGTTAMDVTILGLNLPASTGDGINVLTNSTNNFTLRMTGGQLARNVEIDVTGSGDFAMLVDSTAINTSAGTDIAFDLAFSGAADDGDVTFRNGNNFDAGNASALTVESTGATLKDIKLWIDGTGADNAFDNNSAASPAANFLSSGNTLFQATIQGNTFANADAAGSDFTMTTSGGASARMRLNLGGTTAAEFNSANGQNDFNLVETADGSDFDVFERDDTFANLRNNDSVVPTGTFDDLPTAPTTPTVP